MRYLHKLDNLFDDIFDSDFLTPAKGINTMRTDISEKDNSYVLNMELPGFNKEDVKVSLKDGYLNVSAVHQDNKEEKDKKGHLIRSERYHGTCSRSFYVGDGIKESDINAKFDNGELIITLPKADEKAVEEKHFIPIG